MSLTVDKIKTKITKIKSEEKDQVISNILVYSQNQLVLNKFTSDLASANRASSNLPEEMEDIKINKDASNIKSDKSKLNDKKQEENEASIEVFEVASLDKSI